MEDRIPPLVEYASYLVRFWRRPPEPGDPASGWHGEVEHIQSGRKWQFDSAKALIDFLSRHASCPEVGRPLGKGDAS